MHQSRCKHHKDAIRTAVRIACIYFTEQPKTYVSSTTPTPTTMDGTTATAPATITHVATATAAMTTTHRATATGAPIATHEATATDAPTTHGATTTDGGLYALCC